MAARLVAGHGRRCGALTSGARARRAGVAAGEGRWKVIRPEAISSRRSSHSTITSRSSSAIGCASSADGLPRSAALHPSRTPTAGGRQRRRRLSACASAPACSRWSSGSFSCEHAPSSRSKACCASAQPSRNSGRLSFVLLRARARSAALPRSILGSSCSCSSVAELIRIDRRASRPSLTTDSTNLTRSRRSLPSAR